MLNEFFKLRNKKNEISFSLAQKIVYFDIVDPILLSFENKGNVYVIYLINHKKIRKTARFLVLKSSYIDLERVLMEKDPVNILFKRSNEIEERYIDLKNKMIDSEYITLNKAIDKNYIPSDSFYLDKRYPNKVDLEDLKVKISILRRVFDMKKEIFKLEKSENRDFKTEKTRFHIDGRQFGLGNISIAKNITKKSRFENKTKVYNNFSNDYNIQNKELVDNIKYKNILSGVKKYEG